MKLKNTLMMGALVIVLGAAVYFLEVRGSEERAEAERTADRLLRFETEDVTGLTIAGGDETIVLTHSDDAWRITAPYDLAANDSAVDGIVNQLQSTDSERLVEEQAEDLSRFGLDTPEVTATLQLSDGTTHTLALGAGTPVGFNVYARPNDGAVFLAPGSLKDAVNKTLFDLRDRSIFDLPADQVTRVDVSSETLDVTVERMPPQPDGIQRWAFTAPTEARADRATIATLVSRLQSDRAQSYPSEQPTDEELAAFGLDEPATTLTLWTDAGAAHTLELGDATEDDDGFYGRRAGQEAVFVAPPSMIDLIPESLDELRNTTVVEVARDRIESFELDRGGESLRLEKDGLDWRIINPALDADAASVSSLLGGALALQAVEFGDDPVGSPAYGLADPYLRVTFNLEADTPAVEGGPPAPSTESIVLTVGGATEISEDAEGEENDPEPRPARYVSVSGDPLVYVVDDEGFDGVDVDLFTLRSKTLLSFTQSDLTRIELSAGAVSHQLTKDDNDVWGIAGPAAQVSDIDSAVDNMLFSLNYLTMEAIVADDQPADLSAWGLQSPTFRVRAYIGDQQVADVRVGADVPEEDLESEPEFAPPEQVYLLAGGNGGVYRVSGRLRDTLTALFDAIG